MHHVFLSYNRQDAHWVSELSAVLSARGIPVWVDTRDLPVSLPWMDEVRDAIEEAAVVAVCDSPRWRASPNCAVEKALTDELAKPLTLVAVGADLSVAADAIAAELGLLPSWQAARTELVVRARDWDRTGRPPGALAREADLRRFRVAAERSGFSSPLPEAFMRASRRRVRRRRATVVVAVGLTLVVIAAALLVVAARGYLDSVNEKQAATYSQGNEDINVIRNDPYAGLRRAATKGQTESAVDAEVLGAALRSPVPDDAFTVPSTDLRFAEGPVAGRVVVVDGAGEAWSRDADAPDVREAERGGVDLPGGEAPPAPWTIDLDGTGVVTVAVDGAVQRRLVASAPVEVATISPTGRLLAASTGADVELIDVATGRAKTTLRGAPAALVDVAWAADESRIWGVAADGTVVGWPVRTGTVLRDEPGRWLQGIFAGPEPDSAWVVARDGEFLLLDLESGDPIRSFTVGDEIYQVAVDPPGRAAMVSAKAGPLLVDLDEGTSRAFDLDPCPRGRFAYVPGADVIAMPCRNGPVLLLSSETGEEVRRLDIPGVGAESVTANPSGSGFFVGGFGGSLFEVDEGLQVRQIHTLKCRDAVEVAPSTADGTQVLIVANSAGLVGCGMVGARTDSGWEWNAVIDNVPGSTSALAATFLGDDALAVGYGDGTILVRPAQNLEPTRWITELPDAVRGILPRAGTDEFVVVTRSGMVERFAAPPDELTDVAFVAEAKRRLERAAELGLTDR